MQAAVRAANYRLGAVAMARLCFLFNHDQQHQLAHSLPIAIALMRRTEHEVVLATSADFIDNKIRQELVRAGLQPNTVRLSLSSTASRLLSAGLEWLLPAHKILLYRDNLDFFRSFDALVTAEKTSLLLRTRYGLDGLKFIHTRHGAGDRAIGFGPESRHFDLTLVSGPKIARRLIEEAGVRPERIATVGYVKFDMHGANRIENPFPDKNRPTVLYAPHPSPKLSSYYRMGARVLEEFAASDRFNLIFAPHVMLFQRRRVITISPPAISKVPEVPKNLLSAPNILIDRGSSASSDMSYTNFADVYIGDASSQVYEFLYRPRPTLHIDTHGTDWEGNPNYMHWTAGPVCRDAGLVIDAVDEAIATHHNYRPAQQQLLADTFSPGDRPATERAAAAIAHFMET